MSETKVVADNKLFSLSEWFERAGFANTQAFRLEDNAKRDRLEVLFQETGLLYDRPDKFPAKAVRERQPEFMAYLENNKDRLCAFRLLPQEPHLPKLRMRGKTVFEALDWLDEQDIDFAKYALDIVPHTDKTLWSASLIINEQGIMGEIIRGGHSLLSQGSSQFSPLFFSFDFKQWKFSEEDNEAILIIKKGIASIKIEKDKQPVLAEKLSAEFVQDYLQGYFEFTVWPDQNIYFIDYNRILVDRLQFNNFQVIEGSGLNGFCASGGTAEAPAIIVDDENRQTVDFPMGNILVCPFTSPEYLPLMQKASAIITEQGGLLSHAAIVARELNIPCVVGVKDATRIIENGQMLKIDADQGLIQLFNRYD